MDILLNKLTLLVIAIMVVTVFFMYSITVIHRDGAVAYLAQLDRKLKWVGTTLISFSGALVNLLAASADTSGKKDGATEGNLTGVYNFRTCKYDNGTDPYGWYEEDL